MNDTNDPITQCMDSCDRMLRYARVEHAAKRSTNVADMLRTAMRNLSRALELVEARGDVIPLHAKEADHAR